MAPTLEELRDDLIRRWKAAFDRMPEALEAAPNVRETVYTRTPAFALADYTPRKFKAGARVSKVPIHDVDGYAFDLDSAGRPLRVRHEHTFKRVEWRGVYRYLPDEVEYIDFCLQTRVPFMYNRLVLVEGTAVAEQRFICNGGGAGDRLSQGSVDDKILRVLSDPRLFYIYVTRYDVEGRITRSGEELQIVGGKVLRSTLEYRWADGGKLERIVQHWPGEGSQTVFAAKTKATLAQLSELLSARIADATLAALADAGLSSPLVAVELNYFTGQHHVPQVIPLTAADSVDSPELVTHIDPGRWISLPEEQFAPEITEFVSRSRENVDAVSTMLRSAARRITERARDTLDVVDDFVAFAIDWELEGEQLESILEECGGSRASIESWTKPALH